MQTYDYLDAISAIKATFLNYRQEKVETLSAFAFGWLTAKGVPCRLCHLNKAILRDLFQTS